MPSRSEVSADANIERLWAGARIHETCGVVSHHDCLDHRRIPAGPTSRGRDTVGHQTICDRLKRTPRAALCDYSTSNLSTTLAPLRGGHHELA
jgi:hypothetical protein